MQCLAGGVLGASASSVVVLPAPAHEGLAGASRLRLAACWDDAHGTHRAGWLAVGGAHTEVLRSVELPTRGHGLMVLADGGLLVVARRPGDWLLHARPNGQTQWVWAEADRAFCGHAWLSGDGRTVFTTEMDADNGNGLLGVRDARTLEKTAEWRTHGTDPHAVVSMPTLAQRQGGGVHPLAGMLFVANGGIATTRETGRSKRNLHRMDASVACLHPISGELVGQWRLDDARLSLRHLAWVLRPDGQPVLGVALQAEHDAADERLAAPLLAVLDWSLAAEGALKVASGQPPWGGYGGDVVALPCCYARAACKAGFAVSATRGHAVLRFDSLGRYLGHTHWPSAGALAEDGALRAGGAGGVLTWAAAAQMNADFSAGRIDNHWVVA